jgi:hypothetical protein
MKRISVLALVIACMSPVAVADTVILENLTAVAAQSDPSSGPGAFAMGLTTMAGYLALRVIRRRMHFHHRARFSDHAHFGSTSVVIDGKSIRR